MDIQALVQHYGYAAVVLGTFLEGETVLVLAGFAAHAGYLDLGGVMAAAFAGSVAGDQLYFFLGRRHGTALLHRHPDWVARVQRGQQLLERHQVWVILGFRFLYGLRTVTPLAIGLSRVSAARFAVLNLAGAAFWSIGVAAASYAFGNLMQLLLGDLRHYQIGILLAIAVGGTFVWLGSRSRARAVRPVASDGEG